MAPLALAAEPSDSLHDPAEQSPDTALAGLLLQLPASAFGALRPSFRLLRTPLRLLGSSFGLLRAPLGLLGASLGLQCPLLGLLRRSAAMLFRPLLLFQGDRRRAVKLEDKIGRRGASDISHAMPLAR